VGKYYSKPKTMWGNIVIIHSVLKKKLRSKILNQLNMKKIKSTKTILKKKEKKFIKKRKKIMQGNIVIIHNVLKKKNTELNSQLVQY